MRIFKHDPKYWGIDNTALVSNCGTRYANDRDMEWFFRAAEPDLDRLALKMCADERARGNRIPGWLLDYEASAFLRNRGRH